jgi:Flp pilus assembly protein TadG
MIKRFLRCTRATAAVEAAIFAPIFLLLTLGVTDLGIGMFVRMSVNAATQSGAIYALVNSGTGKPCQTMSAGCLASIKTRMNDAVGDSSFCTSATCTATISPCADGAPACIVVTARYQYAPLILDTVYAWAQSTTVTSTTTVRVL